MNVRDSAHLYPATGVTAEAMAEEDVSFLVSRVARTRSPLESKPPSGLPTADLFHEPAGALLLTVTGAEISSLEGSSTQISLQDTSSKASDAINAMITGGSTQRTVSGSVCASLDASIAQQCSDDAAVFTWDKAKRAFGSITVDSLFQGDQGLFNAVGLDIASDAAAVHNDTGITLDLTDAATVEMLAELQLLHQLPSTFEKADTLPEFAVLSIVGAQIFSDAHGSDSPSLAAVDAVVAAAVPAILDAWSAAYGDDQYQVAVFRHNAAPTAAGRRRVLSTKTSGATAATGYTWSDISEFQIFTWTWFILLLVIFFSACSLGGLDIGNDDAGLYSNFKAGSYDRVGHEHDN